MGTLLQQPQLSWSGRMGLMRARITYADDGVDYALPELPAGTMILHIHKKVTEIFDDSGADELLVGHSGDADAFNKLGDTTMTATADYTATTGAEGYPYQLEADREILLRYDGANGDSTQGIVDVTVIYGLCGV